jgi:hypothetical protein
MELKENLPAVRANPAQIRQVVMNLITNASEAIGESCGVITIATSEAEAKSGLSVSAQGQREGGGARLEVSDTRRGMAEEIQARSSIPFSRPNLRAGAWGSPPQTELSGFTAAQSTSPARQVMVPDLRLCCRAPVRRHGTPAIPRPPRPMKPRSSPELSSS